METTSVEDFYNSKSVGDIGTDLLQTPNLPVEDSRLEIDNDQESLSGSAHQSSGPGEAFFDHPTRTSSPRTSTGTEDEISVLESHYDLQNHGPSIFTPLKLRSPFRNPSSVRAMQMNTTPPHLTSPSSQQRRKIYNSSRQGTPHSTRSHRSTVSLSSPSKPKPNKKIKKEYPLVLLHVTLLPIPLVYSQQILKSVLPPSTLLNWKMLLEKATPTVLERGILIPHPKEDYDLLEERLLESLELKTPRILKCGHFHLTADEEADVIASGGEFSDSDNDDSNDMDICLDCGRRIRDGKFGTTGEGNKRWDIKLFAANGLMRAGAWSAAWREMERVDVEILPWMEDDMKRELDMRQEDEEERIRSEHQHIPMEREEGVAGLDDARLREIYGEGAVSGDKQAFVDPFEETTPLPTSRKASSKKHDPRYMQGETPLWDLLVEYIYHIVQERRNIAIMILSLVILLLSLRSPPPPQLTPQPTNQATFTMLQPTPTIPVAQVTIEANPISLSSPSEPSLPAPPPVAQHIESPTSDPPPVSSEQHNRGADRAQE